MKPARVSLVRRAHELIQAVVQPGDTVIDATTGNGHDTLFLAQAVGNQGKVYGFDIQQAALDETYRRLQQYHVEQRVSLFHAGHEMIPVLIPEAGKATIRAAMFNLGYLPGGDKSRITTPATTLSAIDAATQQLLPGGRITIIAYTGHPGGRDEYEQVLSWAATLPRDLYQISLESTQGDQGQPSGNAPCLIMIEKRIR